LRAPPHKRNKNVWCEFHQDHGHLTDKCFSLKDEIEKMLKEGKLRKYVDKGAFKRGQGDDPRKKRSDSRREYPPNRRDSPSKDKDDPNLPPRDDHGPVKRLHMISFGVGMISG